MNCHFSKKKKQAWQAVAVFLMPQMKNNESG
jgi:hypothetical protein